MAMARGLDFSELSSSGGTSSSFSALNEDTRQTIGFDAAASAGLFVGVRQFVDEVGQPSEELQRIPFAVDDAIDLAALFVLELALLQASRVKLLLSGEPQKPTSQAALAALRAAGAQVDEASYTKVLAGIRAAAGSARPEGLLLISVATHGFSLEDDRLLCADSNRSDLEDTSISLSKLQRLLTASPCPRRLLLVDACREQVELSRGIGAPANQLADALGRVEGLAVLCAAPPRGFSFDDPDRQNGVFTSRVLEGLRAGAPANAEGLVTVQEYRAFVEDHGYQTRAWWRDEGWAMIQALRHKVPEAWTDLAFNAPNQPVVGVSGWEAEAFCAWLQARWSTHRPTSLDALFPPGSSVQSVCRLPSDPSGNTQPVARPVAPTPGGRQIRATHGRTITNESSIPPPSGYTQAGPPQRASWTWREMWRNGAETPGTGPMKMRPPMAASGFKRAMQPDRCLRGAAGLGPRSSFAQPIASGGRSETGLEIPGSGQS